MRLINADNLERSLTEIDDHINMDIFTDGVRELIENTPTVEAIPIEWLKNELIPKAEKLGATEYANNIRFVLEDWEAWKKYRG